MVAAGFVPTSTQLAIKDGLFESQLTLTQG